MADATESGDDFLSDVATFGGADGVGFKTGFGRKSVGSDIHTPKRETAGDAQRLPIGKRVGSGFPRGVYWNPEVEARFAKAGAVKGKRIFWRIGGRGRETRKMCQRVGGGEVFDADIIGDDKFFDSCAERFAQGGVGLDEQGIGCGSDADIGIEPALGGDDGGADGVTGLEFFEILGDLTVEEADAVGTAQAKECAGAGEPGAGG